jgi:hypothetical protein
MKLYPFYMVLGSIPENERYCDPNMECVMYIESLKGTEAERKNDSFKFLRMKVLHEALELMSAGFRDVQRTGYIVSLRPAPGALEGRRLRLVPWIAAYTAGESFTVAFRGIPWHSVAFRGIPWHSVAFRFM